MTSAELTAILKYESFKFKVARCRDENIPMQSAKFLRWVLLHAPCTNAQVNDTFGIELASKLLKSGYVTNPPGRHEDEETHLWMLTPAGVELLKRLVE